MSNQQTFESILKKIERYAQGKIERSEFALDFIDLIEEIDDLSFSDLDAAKEWQYQIETHNDSLSPASKETLKNLKRWINQLMLKYE